MSNSFYLDYKKMKETGAGSLMMRLGMALNDLGTTSFITDNGAGPQAEQQQLGLYAFRMQVSHLCEGILIANEINKCEQMQRYVARLNAQSKAAYDRFTAMQQADTVPYEMCRKYLKNVRDKVGFHYDHDVAKKALAHLASQEINGEPDLIVSATHPVSGFRLAFADKIIEQAIQTQWKVNDKDANSEQMSLQQVQAWCSDQLQDFYTFGRTLCHEFCLEHILSVDDVHSVTVPPKP